MAWEVRPTTSLEEFKQAVGAIGHFFGGWPTDDEAAERFARNLPLERMHAAWDGERIVGGAGTIPFELTVPGGTLPCAGVTVVGVLPTHRRRGILTAMMREQLDDVRRRGEPLAALWASEETIYGRFGYGVASLGCEVELAHTHNLLRAPTDGSTRTRLVSLEEAKELVPPIYDRVRQQTPGMFSRSATWWENRILADPPERREGAGEKNAAVLELDGRPAGYALYRMTMKWDGGISIGHAQVIEAMADSAVATRELWRLLLELDWVASTKASLLPVDHPLFLLVRSPRRLRMRVGDGLWCRLVDVGAALSGRSYAADDEIVLEVADDFLPDNAGRWRLAGGEASRTDADADLALNVTELGTVYLGGFTFAELVRAGSCRSSGLARSSGPMRSSGPTSGPGVPKSSRASAVTTRRAPGMHGPATLRRRAASSSARSARILVTLALPAPAHAVPDVPLRIYLEHLEPLALSWPADGTVTDGFGLRWGRQHSGIDIGILRAPGVRAAAGGTVTATGYLDGYEGYGNVVVVDVGEGFEVLYAHLATIGVRIGDWLDRDEAIGIARLYRLLHRHPPAPRAARARRRDRSGAVHPPRRVNCRSAVNELDRPEMAVRASRACRSSDSRWAWSVSRRSLFSDLPQEELVRVAELSESLDVPAGEAIDSKDDFAYEFFVIEEGTAEVVSDGRKLADLGPGDFFGEIGLLITGRRTASVVSTSPMRVVAMFDPCFRRMERELPEFAETVRTACKERLPRV